MATSKTFTQQCSAVGSFGYASYFKLYVVLTDRDGSSSTNKSYVDYNVYCQSSGAGSINAYHTKYFSLNGSEKINKQETVNVHSPQAYIGIASGTIEVTHNSDGSKTIPFSARIQGASYGVSATLSGEFTLEKIPRYTTVTNGGKSKTVNSITVGWNATDACDSVQYSLNGGSWTAASGTINSGNKGGQYTVSGLSVNTKYTIKTRCRRTDSQLWSEASTTLTITTYDIARITAAPNVNIGSSHTITWTNPSAASISLKLCKTDNTSVINYGTVTGTSKAVTPTASTIYALIPNANSITLRYIITTTANGTSYTAYKNCVFSVTNSNPTFSNFTYADTNATTIALTGNNQTVIKGYSNVKATISTANKAVAKNSATMSKYRFAIGSETVDAAYSSSAAVNLTINTITNNTFIVYAIDSRGNSTSKSITAAAYINYSPIKITSIVATRTDNVTSKTTLKFSGTIWNGSFGTVTNSIKSCTYRYRKVGATSWTTGATAITPTKSGGTFSLTKVINGDLGASGFDINNSYEIQVLISDQLTNNNSTPATFILGSGTPALSIYKNNVGIGQKYDTSDASKLQVTGHQTVKGPSKTGASKGFYKNDNVTMWVGIGDSGTNYGVYSQTLGNWLMYSDGTTTRLIGNADTATTATNAKKVYGTYLQPTDLVNYPVVMRPSTTTGYNDLYQTPGYFAGVRQGSETAVGISQLVLGNSTHSGTEGNKYGRIALYSQSTGYVFIQYEPTATENTTLTIPRYSGRIQLQPVSLYDNSSGTTGTVTLSETSANFTYIEIFFRDTSNTYGSKSVKVYSPNGKNALLDLVSEDGTNQNLRLNTAIAKISGTSITKANTQVMYILKSGTQDHYNVNEILIYKVVGYR